jgi:integrase
MKDTKYLRSRNGVWYFQKHCQGRLISRCLKTDSLKVAQHARDTLLRKLPFNNLTSEASPKVLRELVESLKTDMQEFYKLNEGDSEDCRLANFFDVESPEDAKDEGNLLKADALLIADAIVLGHPEDISSPHTHIRIDYTIQDAAEEYLKTVKIKKDITTYNAYRRGIANYITYTNEKFVYLKDIKRSSVIAFLTFLSTNKELSRKSISNQLGGLSGCFQYAQDRDWISLESTNPFKNISLNNICTTAKNKYELEKNQPITLDEFKIIQTAINENSGIPPERKWVVPIALVSGMRISELLGLLKVDIKKVNDIWCFDVKPNKYRRLKNKNAERLIPIHISVLKAVLELKSKSTNEFLFQEVASSKRVSGTVGAWYSKLKRHLLPTSFTTFHGLRSTFATALENSGVEENVAASLLGHAKQTLSYGLYSKGHEVQKLKSNLDTINVYYKEFIKLFPTI